jgi:hypothetical protein
LIGLKQADRSLQPCCRDSAIAVDVGDEFAFRGGKAGISDRAYLSGGERQDPGARRLCQFCGAIRRGVVYDQ